MVDEGKCGHAFTGLPPENVTKDSMVAGDHLVRDLFALIPCASTLNGEWEVGGTAVWWNRNLRRC